MADENLAEKIGGFAADASVDTFADQGINTVIDDVAAHIPGGAALDGVIKTGVDLTANNAINAELGHLTGMFGQHPAEPPADASSEAPVQS
jgi:hypothetical protein